MKFLQVVFADEDFVGVGRFMETSGLYPKP